MAGLFDFKSAEEILQERRADTKANQQQLLNTIVSAAPQESRQASMLGAQLGIALGNALGKKQEAEQLQELRDMSETTQAMEQAGVGGEGSAQFDGEGSSYGAGVLQQAQAEEQRRLGLLPQEMQEAERLRIGMERTPEDLDLVGRYRYMAKVLQDAGMTSRAAQAALLADKEAQRQRELREMTPYQQAQVQLGQDKLKQEAAIYGLGTGAGSNTTSANKSYKPGEVITNAEGKQLVVGEDGKLTDKEVYDAQENVKKLGTTIEPSQLEKTYNFLTSPFSAIADAISEREILGKAQMVSGALEKNIASPRDLDAMRDLVKLPQEESGLTIPQYNRAKMLVKANPE